MDEQPHAQHRQEHQPQRQPQNRARVAEQLVLRNAPAVEEQQRRHEEQEEDFGVEFDADLRNPADDRTERDLDEWPWKRRGQQAGNNSAQHDGEEQEQAKRDDVQSGTFRVQRLEWPWRQGGTTGISAKGEGQGRHESREG
ncbi:hypothetical protein GCM10020258_48490 [Sphingomonas yabuuchiae]